MFASRRVWPVAPTEPSHAAVGRTRPIDKAWAGLKTDGRLPGFAAEIVSMRTIDAMNLSLILLAAT